MKKIEIGLAVLAVISLALRVSSIQGSVAGSAIAFMLLALFYLLLSLPYFNRIPISRVFSSTAYHNTGVGAFQRFWAVASGVVFFIALLGILFVLNYWQGAFFFWCMGMFFVAPVAALSLGKHLLQPNPVYKAIALRAGILLLAGIALVAAQM
jgi:hypothetical protein